MVEMESLLEEEKLIILKVVLEEEMVVADHGQEIFVISGLNKDFANLLSEIEKEYEDYKNRVDSTVEDKVKIYFKN